MKVSPPPRGSQKSLQPLHSLQRKTLKNGLRVLAIPRPHLSQACVSVFFPVGSRHEEGRHNGLTHVLEHMLFRGTESYKDATLLNAAAENIGGYLEGATYRDHVYFGTITHPGSIREAVKILSEIVLSPRFLSFDIERNILREELLETINSEGKMVDLDNLAHQAAFGKLGLGQAIEGTMDNLESYTLEDLREHQQKYLVGANAVVVVAGNLDADAMLQAVEEDFSSMPRGERASAKKVPPPVKKPILRFVRDASSQIDLRISFRAPALQESSYSAVFMLSRVLADGLASRMYSELVDKRGLAYVLSAGLTTYEEVSLFDFEVSVASDRASELVRALLDFAHRSRRFRYNDEELERVLRRYRYGMEFMSDVPVDLAGWYGRGVLFGMEAETHALESQLLNVDAARLREAARSLFIPEGMVLAASGDLARGEWKKIREAVDEWSSLQK